MKRISSLASVLALLLTLNLQPSTALALDTAFSYQGRLNASGAPANGSYDVAFTLFATNAKKGFTELQSMRIESVISPACAISNYESECVCGCGMSEKCQ